MVDHVKIEFVDIYYQPEFSPDSERYVLVIVYASDTN